MVNFERMGMNLKAIPSLYDITGDIKDINTMLVPKHLLEAAEKDAARMDWIAMHGSFGVDSVSGEVGGNGQKRIAATRKSIDAAMKEQK